MDSNGKLSNALSSIDGLCLHHIYNTTMVHSSDSWIRHTGGVYRCCGVCKHTLQYMQNKQGIIMYNLYVVAYDFNNPQHVPIIVIIIEFFQPLISSQVNCYEFGYNLIFKNYLFLFCCQPSEGNIVN